MATRGGRGGEGEGDAEGEDLGPLHELIAALPNGRALPGALYADPALHALELERIWRAGWVFAGHSGELRRPGDWLALEIGDDPLVVVRQHDGTVRALHNVCRHRGSVVATEGRGHGALLVCPYHRWSYRLDGTLAACPGASDSAERDRRALGLGEVAAVEAGGLVLVSLAASPPDPEPWRATLDGAPEAGALAAAKVAARLEYDVAADWKLVLENNRECLHCAPNHPQYVLANYDHPRPGDPVEGGLAEFPDAAGAGWWSLTRSLLRPPFVTESLDGSPVAPPLAGSGPGAPPVAAAPDGSGDPGTLRLRILPSFWAHVSADHAVTTQVLPAGAGRTRTVVSWLVHPDAVEGRDYELERLLPFWRLTSEQDWEICARQQRGVRSSAYRPGPLSPTLEYNVAAFHAWYARRMLASPEAPVDEPGAVLGTVGG